VDCRSTPVWRADLFSPLSTSSEKCRTEASEAESKVLDAVRSTYEAAIAASGTVEALGDGIARISGLINVMAGELLVLEAKNSSGEKRGLYGLALNLEEDYVGVVILTKVPSSYYLTEGCDVVGTSRLADFPVSWGFLGRVVDPLGRYIDGLQRGPGSSIEDASSRGAMRSGESLSLTYPGEERCVKNMVIESPAPGIISRRKVCKALQTGVLAVDALIPIGRGQRELVIGDRKTGKTSLVLDAIRSQATLVRLGGDSVVSIYVAIGQKASSVAAVRQVLIDEGIFGSIVFVAANADSLAASLYVAAYSGTSVGEYFMGVGLDVLVVYDDLSKHAAAYREISLLLRRPPGREAYPGDIFYVHARLLERAANLAAGGSLTALPVVETQEGDVSSYIPTNVISITDGQVYLSADLFNAGVLPAIDVGISVSRVGSEAQVGSVKLLTARLKLVLAQLTELEAFSQFSSDLDKRVVQRLESFRRFRELFKQSAGYVYSVASEVLVLCVARSGGLDVVPLGYGFRRFLSVMRAIRLRVRSPLLYRIAGEERDLMESLKGQCKVIPGLFEPATRRLSVMALEEMRGLMILDGAVGLPEGTLSGGHLIAGATCRWEGSFSTGESGSETSPPQLQVRTREVEGLPPLLSPYGVDEGGWTTEARICTGLSEFEENLVLLSASDHPTSSSSTVSTPDFSTENPVEDVLPSSYGAFLDRPFEHSVKSKCSAFGAYSGDLKGRDITIGRYRVLGTQSEAELRCVYHLMVVFLIRALGRRGCPGFEASSWFRSGYCRMILSASLISSVGT
jgi:F-type H+-transporting ATPase subunit alpha